MPADANEYERSVFVNCPFDPPYRPLFEMILFAVCRCGLRPRCALEAADAGQGRVEKILAIIGACRYGIHDVSRTELDGDLPRFNMPLELGMFLGAAAWGPPGRRRKFCWSWTGNPIATRSSSLISPGRMSAPTRTIGARSSG